MTIQATELAVSTEHQLCHGVQDVKSKDPSSDPGLVAAFLSPSNSFFLKHSFLICKYAIIKACGDVIKTVLNSMHENTPHSA